MTKRLLELHLVQAEKALDRSSDNNYSDRSKQGYHEKLNDLHEKIRSAFDELNETPKEKEVFELKRDTDFIFKSLEFLDSSTLNLIPFEIVECLKHALFDWVQPANYIIVTSLINDFRSFSYDPTIAFDEQLFQSLQHKYHVEFTKRLIQINFPRSLSRDYLACVVLYHELGHFVDLKNFITSALTENFYSWINLNPSFQKHVLPYFPFLNLKMIASPDARVKQITQFHFGEYFCDLFASQYVGNSLNSYLYFLTQGSGITSSTHPSTTNRVEIVNDFLSDRQNILLDFIKEGVFQITQNPLKIRYEPIKSKDFFNLLPIEIQNVPQLHGLFPFGWELWSGDRMAFEKSLNTQSPIPSEQLYTILNNLIEKTIGNFIVTQQWQQTIIPSSVAH
ncbi:MAG: hypothetical protein H6577_27800 [Lewinellaceae bacterium]|nr:hypothetical protein [Lewinellaceae bacterium]